MKCAMQRILYKSTSSTSFKFIGEQQKKLPLSIYDYLYENIASDNNL